MLKNQTAMITGCNSGIGKSILNLFSKNNCNVIACIRKNNFDFEEHCKKLEKLNNNTIKIYEFDLQNIDDLNINIKKILNDNKDIDILINNAGSISTNIFQFTTEKNFKDLFQVNFFSVTTITQMITKLMIRKKKGTVINISSISADDGNEARSAYSASKAALQSLTKAMSRELGRFNIRANCIAPGLIDTKMLSENTKPEIIKEMKNRISLARLGTSNEVANVALFLASDLSSYINGQIIRVDGGM